MTTRGQEKTPEERRTPQQIQLMLFSITKRRCNDRRQSKINDNCMEENEYNSKREESYSRRHPKKAEKCRKNNNATWIRQRRLNDRRRQSKIEDSYMEEIEFKSE